MIGKTLLNYRVISQLGSGGLGTVYAAEHTIIGRRAALKVLNPIIAQDELMVQRFLVEARAVAAIRHPNIVDVTDYGKAEGHFVIVMELLDGETLASRLEQDRCLSDAKVIALLTQLTSAVGAAHERSIVHRDLKPENIFLTSYPDYPDFVKVLDFGIAKLLGSDGALKTSPGLIIGTPAYMSPEQCLGDESLDRRSDVYSLGVVAYRMVTGVLPYEGNVMQQLQAHLNQTPRPPMELRPDLDPRLAQVVLRCLARKREDRYQSMKELREALTDLGGRSPIAFSPAEARPPARHHREPTSPAAAPGAPPPPPVEAESRPAPAPAPPPSRNDTRALEIDRTEETERQQALLVAARMREIISKRLQSDSLRLPSLPEVAVTCLQLAHDPNVPFSTLARTIERDPFIVSRLIRMSNSLVYGGLARTTSVDGAIARLGVKALTTVLQELAAEQVFMSRDPVIRNTFRGIWEHCLGVAHLARDLSVMVRTVDPDLAYLAGLFHDIGKPVVAALLLEVERNAKSTWLSGGVWRKVVDECHRDVGATIAFRWYLPREVATAVAELDWYDLKRGRTSAANMVRLSNALCQREGLDVKAADPDELARVIVQGQQVVGVTDEQIGRATRGLVNRVQAITAERSGDNSTQVFDRGATL